MGEPAYNAIIPRTRRTPPAIGEEVRQSDAAAAALIRQLAIEVDDLWGRLSRVYAFLRGESSETLSQKRSKNSVSYSSNRAKFSDAA